MPFRTSLIVASLLALLVAGCGSGSEGTAQRTSGSGNDVNALLRDTFANLGKIHAANLDMKLDITSAGSGPVSAHLSGPFAGQGPGKLPRFAFAAELQSGGRSVTAGATYTGEKAYIALQGTQYAVDDAVLAQLVASYRQAQKQGQAKSGGLVLGTLGVDFSKWLKNARNEGAAQVGDAATVKLTGEADIAQVVDDLDKIAAKARALNVPGASGQLPQQLTPQQKQQAVQAIKSLTVTVYTGAQDRILRRLVVAADIAASTSDAKLALDLTLTKVGQDQEITAPKNAKPFSELQKAIQAAGFGGLGSTAGGGTGANNVDKYAECIKKAAGNVTEGRKCAALLSG